MRSELQIAAICLKHTPQHSVFTLVQELRQFE